MWLWMKSTIDRGCPGVWLSVYWLAGVSLRTTWPPLTPWPMHLPFLSQYPLIASSQYDVVVTVSSNVSSWVRVAASRLAKVIVTISGAVRMGPPQYLIAGTGGCGAHAPPSPPVG